MKLLFCHPLALVDIIVIPAKAGIQENRRFVDKTFFDYSPKLLSF